MRLLVDLLFIMVLSADQHMFMYSMKKETNYRINALFDIVKRETALVDSQKCQTCLCRPNMPIY